MIVFWWCFLNNSDRREILPGLLFLLLHYNFISVIIVFHMVSEIYFSWSMDYDQNPTIISVPPFHNQLLRPLFDFPNFPFQTWNQLSRSLADSLAMKFDFLLPIKKHQTPFPHFSSILVKLALRDASQPKYSTMQLAISVQPSRTLLFVLFFFLFPRPSCSS